VGAQVFEETKVTALDFDGTRPISASWKNKSGEASTIRFDYVIDASGRAGIMSTKYLKNRIFNDNLKNVAIWGYWTGHGKYLPGTERENSPLFEAIEGISYNTFINLPLKSTPKDETGWTWYIPLHDDTVSIGIVMNQEKSNAKKATAKEAGEDTSLEAHYHRQLRLTPNIVKLLGDAKMVKKPDAPMVSSASDYSYQASHYAGPGYRLVGDAAGTSAYKTKEIH
jgi:flavin-dependent dehydrogenase